jgi:transposase-like protein
MTEKIRVTCSRCKSGFREKVANIREGFQAQCPSCNRLITFSVDSGDASIKKAIVEARRIRNGFIFEAKPDGESRHA